MTLTPAHNGQADDRPVDHREPPQTSFDSSRLHAAFATLFLATLAQDFRRHGLRTIRQVREKSPPDYLKLVAALLPDEVRLEEADSGALTGHELAALLKATREALAREQKRRREGGGDRS
jgi:hypothetical protein